MLDCTAVINPGFLNAVGTRLGLSVTSNFPLISDDDETPVPTARTSIDNPRRSLILNSPFPNKKV